jgi:hypothetical protein
VLKFSLNVGSYPTELKCPRKESPASVVPIRSLGTPVNEVWGLRFLFKLEKQENKNKVYKIFVFYGVPVFTYAVNALLCKKPVIIDVYDFHVM